MIETRTSRKRWTFVGVAVLFAAVLFIAVLASQIRFDWVEFALIASLLSLLFPVSATAFVWLEVPHLVEQMRADCYLLGRPMTAGLPAPAATPPPPSARWAKADSFSQRWNFRCYLIHYGLAIFATILGVSLFFRQPESVLDINTQHAMQFGFLGAYVYCLNLVYRRYTTLDLQPHVYLYCAVGLIAGMVFNFVAFTAINDVASPVATEGSGEFTGIGAGVAAILAFSLGYFPNLAIRWFGRVSRSSTREQPRRSDALPLSLIDGISELHESRLRDEGVDNIQNLATSDIPALVVTTPFSAQEIVEWTDQAVLYLYLDPGEIESFRRSGVRTVSDFQDIWQGFSVRYKLQSDGTVQRIPVVGDDAVKDFEDRRKAIAQQLATTEQRLDSLFRATEQGPNMEYVRTYWENVQKVAARSRAMLVNQVCGRIGRAVRECMREGESLKSADILQQIAEELFSAAANRDYDEAVDVTAESLYGQAYLKNCMDRIGEARQLYEQCIAEFPSDPIAYNDLAWLDLHTLSTRSAFMRARDYAEKAVELAKKSSPPQSDLAPYLDTLAFAYCRLGDPDAGMRFVQEAVDAWKAQGRKPDPRFLETFVKVAEAYFAEGNDVKAEEVLEFVTHEEYVTDGTLKKIAALRKEHED